MANVIGSGIARTIVDADGDPVNVSDAGNLMVDIGAASISGDLSVNLTQTDKVSIWGNEQADGEGTARAILTDDGGRLQIDVITAPSTAVTCDTAGNLLATVTQQSTARTVTCDTAGNLLATVTQDSAARTVTGTVGHNIATIASGEMDVTTAGTALVLSATQACKKVDIQAKITNTGKIYIGGTSVDSDEGLELRRGDIYSLEIADLNDVYVDCSVSGEGVRYTWYG